MSNDPEFKNRSNAVIDFFNEQMQKSGLPPHFTAASGAYAAARFAVWAAARNTVSVDELKTRRQHVIDTFAEGHRQMLEEHFDEYVNNYDQYFQQKPGVILP
ncbi:MAG: DUF3144 domain-containing protein [Asticcacaulis sp.]|uniref:DUF3144 domain-containing protein n=1 Tax=Asticcacaulis sp. TaxID=1872648 RepID=UPI0039E2199F